MTRMHYSLDLFTLHRKLEVLQEFIVGEYRPNDIRYVSMTSQRMNAADMLINDNRKKELTFKCKTTERMYVRRSTLKDARCELEKYMKLTKYFNRRC